MKVTEVVLSLSSWLSHGTEDVGGTEGEICDDGLASLELPSAEPTRFHLRLHRLRVDSEN